MTPDEVLIAIGREVCAELALYGKLRDLNALSESGEQWLEVLQTLVLQAHTKCGECGGHLTRSICDDCGTKHSGWDRYPSVTNPSEDQ